MKYNDKQLCIIGVLIAKHNRDSWYEKNYGHAPDGWMSLNELERSTGLERSTCRYWAERLTEDGTLRRRQANLGHGYYWWYEYHYNE